MGQAPPWAIAEPAVVRHTREFSERFGRRALTITSLGEEYAW